MKRIPSLDGFRAISILLILFCHARLSAGFPNQLAEVAKEAAVGVTVFFVISGFLITNLLLVEEANTGRINVRSFYIRRVLRIMPVYVLYTAFILVWRNIEPIPLSSKNLLHVFTFTVNFDSTKGWFLGHFWSLSVEEQFYIFWPAMLILLRKHLKPALCVLIIYCCVARVIDYKFPAYQTLSLSPFFMYADAIFIGSLGGIMFFENPGILRYKIFNSYIAQIAALFAICVLVYLSGHGKLALISLPFGNLIISISILFLLFSYITPSTSVVFKFLNNKYIVHIGVLSYSIYVWQEFFVVGPFIWRTFPLNILVIYIVSLASYYLWEKPFLKLKHQFASRKLQAAK